MARAPAAKKAPAAKEAPASKTVPVAKIASTSTADEKSPDVDTSDVAWFERPGVPRHRVISPLRMHRKRFAVGDIVTLTEVEAAPLLGHTVTPHED